MLKSRKNPRLRERGNCHGVLQATYDTARQLATFFRAVANKAGTILRERPRIYFLLLPLHSPALTHGRHAFAVSEVNAHVTKINRRSLRQRLPRLLPSVIRGERGRYRRNNLLRVCANFLQKNVIFHNSLSLSLLSPSVSLHLHSLCLSLFLHFFSFYLSLSSFSSRVYIFVN